MWWLPLSDAGENSKLENNDVLACTVSSGMWMITSRNGLLCDVAECLNLVILMLRKLKKQNCDVYEINIW